VPDSWQEQFVIIKKIASEKMRQAGKTFSISALDRFLDLETKRARYWDRGQRPTASDLVRISDKLGISLRWLVTGEGEPLDGDTALAAPDGSTALAAAEARIRDLERRLLAAQESLNVANQKVIVLQDELRAADRQLAGRDVPPARGEGNAAPSSHPDNE
jgi:hypothetical protein